MHEIVNSLKPSVFLFNNNRFLSLKSPTIKKRENGEKGKWREKKMAALAAKASQQPKQLVHMGCKIRKKGDYNEKS